MKCPLFDQCIHACCCCESVADDTDAVKDVERAARENCFEKKELFERGV